MFDFNASLNDVAPVSPMLFPVYFMRMGKSGLLMDFFCRLFLLYLLLTLSFKSVVFVFNASLNDATPVSLIWLSVNWMLIAGNARNLCVISFVFTS